MRDADDRDRRDHRKALASGYKDVSLQSVHWDERRRQLLADERNEEEPDVFVLHSRTAARLVTALMRFGDHFLRSDFLTGEYMREIVGVNCGILSTLCDESLTRLMAAVSTEAIVPPGSDPNAFVDGKASLPAESKIVEVALGGASCLCVLDAAFLADVNAAFLEHLDPIDKSASPRQRGHLNGWMFTASMKYEDAFREYVRDVLRAFKALKGRRLRGGTITPENIPANLAAVLTTRLGGILMPIPTTAVVVEMHRRLTSVRNTISELAAWFDGLGPYCARADVHSPRNPSHDLSTSICEALDKEVLVADPASAKLDLFIYLLSSATGVLSACERHLKKFFDRKPFRRPRTTEDLRALFPPWIVQANAGTDVAPKKGRQGTKDSEIAQVFREAGVTEVEEIRDRYAQVVGYMTRSEAKLRDVRLHPAYAIRLLACSPVSWSRNVAPDRRFTTWFPVAGAAVLEEYRVAAYRPRLLRGPCGILRRDVIDIMRRYPSTHLMYDRAMDVEFTAPPYTFPDGLRTGTRAFVNMASDDEAEEVSEERVLRAEYVGLREFVQCLTIVRGAKNEGKDAMDEDCANALKVLLDMAASNVHLRHDVWVGDEAPPSPS